MLLGRALITSQSFISNSSRGPWRAAHRQVSPLAFCSVDSGQAVGSVVVGWPDLARLPLGGDGRRWRARFRELQRPGRVLGRWATADGDFYCDSFKSQGVMGPRQLTVGEYREQGFVGTPV